MTTTNTPNPGPAVTSANVPTQPPNVPHVAPPVEAAPPPVEQVIGHPELGEMDDSLFARPLNNPDFEQVLPKNPNLRFRWINRDAPEGRSIRFSQAQTQGFVPAIPSDVKNPDVVKPYLRDGHYINGDIILMKIDRRAYDGALRYNRDRALRLGSKAVQAPRDVIQGKAEASIQEGSARAPKSQLEKVSLFTPTEKEIDTLTGKDRDKDLK